MSDCLFCRIVAGTIPSTQVYSDEYCIAFRDIHPKANVHVLVVPRRHIESFQFLTADDAALMGHMVLVLDKIAQQQGLKDGFRTIINTGPGGRQEVGHLHFHLLGGALLPSF